MDEIQYYFKGAILISKENNRYALGGGKALKIHVIKEK